jgi:hypothetical protein
MRLVTLISACGVLSACARQPPPPSYAWYNPTADAQTFARDRYACLQQSQQPRSSAYVTGNFGSADSTVATNFPLFSACMQARGYSWVRDRTNTADTSTASPRTSTADQRTNTAKPNWPDYEQAQPTNR